VIVFPNCKINLGLNIIRKREDGYHDVETVFYPIQINDVLEIIKSETKDSIEGVQFTSSGLTIDGNTSGNLCVIAYQLLKKDFPSLPSVKMHLHKHIPMGAGLGGGSADGAFALKLLNDKFKLNLSKDQLINYALQLGSDCPFFIINQPCFASSRGEVMENIAIDLSAYQFVIVNPGIHVSTSLAFKNITPTIPHQSIKEMIQQPVETWKSLLVNDFEKAIAKEHPAINEIKEHLYSAGAVYASMTGSGSTVFGIFTKTQRPALVFPESYFVQTV